MCGIGGIINKETLTDEQSLFFQELMSSLQSRGKDAMGFVAYPNNLTPIRHTGDVDDYLKSGRRNIWTKVKSSIMALGHTRAKTRGCEKKSYNNHPFSTKDFIMAHNGTIRNDDKIKNYFKIKTKVETDSYVIIRLIQHFFNKNKDIPVAICEARDRLQGSYACWLLHKETGDLYLFKSTGAELAVAYLRPWDCFIFGSSLGNFKDLVIEKINKSNQECGLFNTNIVVKKLDDDKIYKINLSTAKTKRERTTIYEYVKNEVEVPDVKKKTDDDDKDDKELSVYDRPTAPFRNNRRARNKIRYKTEPKDLTGVEAVDLKLKALQSLGFEFECFEKVKLYFPDNPDLKKIMIQNGISLGGVKNDRLKIKMKRPLLLLSKIENLAIKHCNNSLPLVPIDIDRVGGA